MRLLVVEDDRDLNRQISSALEQAGYAVDRAFDGEDGWFRGDTEPYDAVVLDIGLPKRDGISVLEAWRKAGRTMPVLILTARDRWSDKVQGIDAGADDYVAKPFHMEEVLARLRALLRRAAGHATSDLAVGPVRLDARAGRVTVNGELVKLTSHEYRLLSYLMHHAGRIISRTEIVEHLYEQDFDRDSNTIEVFIGRLRKKLGVDIIKTVARPRLPRRRRRGSAGAALTPSPRQGVERRRLSTGCWEKRRASALAHGDEIGGGAQDVARCADPGRVDRRLRLADESGEFGARSVALRARRRASPCGARRPCRRACRASPRRLRRRAGRRRSGTPRRSPGRTRANAARAAAPAPARSAPASTLNLSSAPVFIACRRAIASIESGAAAVSASMSSIWPPTMPARPAARARPTQSPARDRGVGIGPRIGENLEGQRLQGVARQNGGRLVEGAVSGRPAAPQVVVVHRRQIVVDQRIGVHAFDRRAGQDRRAVGAAERARGFDREKGPQPLAAAERGVAHRFDQTARPRDLPGLRLDREKVVERPLDRRRGLGQSRPEGLFVHGSVRLLRRRSRRG